MYRVVGLKENISCFELSRRGVVVKRARVNGCADYAMILLLVRWLGKEFFYFSCQPGYVHKQ